MRRASWFLAVPFTALGLCAFVACVGDDASTSVNDPANDGGTNGDGSSSGNDGSSSGDSSTIGDGATVGDGEAGVPGCGYPGEACCAAPSLPCRAGTSCSTGTKKCLVNDVWAVGQYTVLTSAGGFDDRAITAHYDGTAWTIGPKIPTNWNPAKIYQTGPSAVRVVSRANNDRGGKMFYQFSPTEFRECTFGSVCPVPLLSAGKLVDFYDITNVDNEFWLAGVNQIYRCATGAGSCASTTTGISGTWAFGNFAGTTSTDLWYSAIDRAFHYNGTAWTVHPNLQAYAIYQVRKDDTWVGTKTLQHWNGTAWSAEMTVDGAPLPGNIYSIGGSATDDLWAVGNNGNDASFAAHWNGTAWTNVPLPATAKWIESLYAPSKTEAFIVGLERHPTDSSLDKQGIFHWDGATWKLVPSPAPTLAAGETQFLSNLRWTSVHGLARPRP